jgi:hypothetical protein
MAPLVETDIAKQRKERRTIEYLRLPWKIFTVSV